MATARQYLVPGEGFVNENSPPRQYLVPGLGFANNTSDDGLTRIKTINGLAKASVKTYNGLAIASVKKINGLA